MKSRTFCFSLFSVIAIGVTTCLPAQAQRARVFVSVHGQDGNPCTALSPCRTFQYAHDNVLAGGEISVLDSGGYGPVVITKSVSIVNPAGVEAAIAVASNETAISVGAGASDTVSLRGLILDGSGAGGIGIYFTGGAALEVVDCVIRNYKNFGIVNFSFATYPMSLSITNVTVSNIGSTGIAINPSNSPTIEVTLNRVELRNNQVNGLEIDASPTVQRIVTNVIDSVLANNGQNGVFAYSIDLGDSVTQVSLLRSVATNNGTGVKAEGPTSTIRLAESMLTGNAQGWAQGNGSLVQSYGNNFIDGNTIVNQAPPGIPMK